MGGTSQEEPTWEGDAAEGEHPPGEPSHRGRRALVSALILAALCAVTLTSPWGVSGEDFIESDGAALLAQNPPAFAVIGQFITAFSFVEFVAIVVPWLRRRRHDHPRIRRLLTASSLALGALLTAFSGWSGARLLVTQGMSESVQGRYLASSLGGVVALFAALAALRRWGFGGAWAGVLIAINALAVKAVVAALVTDPSVAIGQVVVQGAFFAGWVALAWGFLSGRLGRSRFGAPEPTNAPGVYRETSRASAVVAFRLRAPLWGTQPLAFSVGHSAAASVLVLLHMPGAEGLQGGWGREPWVIAALSTVVALLMIALIERLPTSLRSARATLARLPGDMAVSLDASRADAARATRTMALALVAFELLGGVTRQPIHSIGHGMVIMVCTALVMDVVDEWRASARHGELTAVVEEQRVWFADALATALNAHGVPAFVRSANFRQLMWFSTPYVPVAVLVPAARRDEARSLLAAWETAGSATVEGVATVSAAA